MKKVNIKKIGIVRFVGVSHSGKGLHKELVPVKYVVARNKVTGDEIDYRVWKKMSSAGQDRYELEEMS